MKGDSMMGNIEDIFMSNSILDKKIKFLENEKIKRQNFITDLQETLILNKESIACLASSLEKESIAKLNHQNTLLHKQLRYQYEENLNTRAFLLIEQQLRIEEKKSYNQRLLQFQTHMAELRKYLQDKQDSFSAIVIRLKKYQDLNQVSLSTKLISFQNTIKQNTISRILEDLTIQRDKYKSIWNQFSLQLEDLSFLKECFENKTSYEQMLEIYESTLKKQASLMQENKFVSFYEKNKTVIANRNQLDLKVEGKSSSVQANRELIKLLKKQKVNNEILGEALDEAIQKNQQLVIENNTLVDANIELQLRIEKLEAKTSLLQEELKRIEEGKKQKIDKVKTQLDFLKVNENSFTSIKGNQANQCLDLLQIDMEKLSKFIMLCVPKAHLGKSSSAPRLSPKENQYLEENGLREKDEDLEIEQI